MIRGGRIKDVKVLIHSTSIEGVPRDYNHALHATPVRELSGGELSQRSKEHLIPILKVWLKDDSPLILRLPTASSWEIRGTGGIFNTLTLHHLDSKDRVDVSRVLGSHIKCESGERLLFLGLNISTIPLEIFGEAKSYSEKEFLTTLYSITTECSEGNEGDLLISQGVSREGYKQFEYYSDVSESHVNDAVTDHRRVVQGYLSNTIRSQFIPEGSRELITSQIARYLRSLTLYI